MPANRAMEHPAQGPSIHDAAVDAKTNDATRNPVRGTQVGRTLASAIKDQELMSDQYRFGDNGTESNRPRQSGQGDDQMNEEDSEVAHPGHGINTSKSHLQLGQFDNSP
jgi:hypothetical protein